MLHRLNDVLEDQAKRIAVRASRRGLAAAGVGASRAGRRRDPSAGRARQRKFTPCAVCSTRSRTASGASRTSCGRRSSTTWACVPAIEFLADGISQRWGIPVTVRGTVGGSLPRRLKPRCTAPRRKALTNVARHAQATHAEVRCHQSPHLITCSVRDDGMGCDRRVVPPATAGAGSAWSRSGNGSRHWAAPASGPALEQGTDFTVEIPLEAST